MRAFSLTLKLVSVACWALLAAGAAQATDGVTPQRVVVGQTISLDAGKNAYGTAVLAGAQAYFDGVNASGGVHGRQIVLKVLDDHSRAAQAEANARQLIQKEGAFLLFGSIEGGPSTAVMKVASELKVPFFGPMAGSPTLRTPHQPMVFPVRAEHREEFRAILTNAKGIGLVRVAFFRADSEVGEQHLANVRRICQELGLTLAVDLPFKSDVSDAQLDAMAARMVDDKAQLVFNHGSIGPYEKLIRRAHARGAQLKLYGVNSGSTQLMRNLGPLAHGMIFAQVVPDPWARKAQTTREYQDAFARAKPGHDYSYGSLEGYLTAKALVAALRLAGSKPTREGFAEALHRSQGLDLAGLRARYTRDNHLGLQFVELAIVSRDSRFMH